MKLSIVDLSHVPTGGTAIDAMANSVDLARRAERLGYHRYWVAEHHANGDQTASSNPEVLIARIAALTSTIRVGSGTVLLNHYSPFKVAETFKLLHAMTPGRIDLGIGRANSGPVVDYALQRDRREMLRLDDYDQQVLEVLSWLDNAFPGDHPFAQVDLMASVPGNPEAWLLGSSPNSARLAGQLGMRYCFAGFINPGAATTAASIYRSSFTPRDFASGPREPFMAVSINACVAETETEAAKLRATVELYYQRLFAGRFSRDPLPLPEEAVAELGGIPDPVEVKPGSWPARISGTPAQMAEMLRIIAADVGAEEVVIQDQIARHEDRVRSYELLASVPGLVSPDPVSAKDAGA